MSLIIVCSTGNIKARVAIPQSAWAFWETPGHDWRLQPQSDSCDKLNIFAFKPLHVSIFVKKVVEHGGGGGGGGDGNAWI
jgi:hypothetical protein